MARARSGSLRSYVAANARRLREERGLTQEEFAPRIGTSPRYLRSIETSDANVTLDTLELLAAKLGVDPLELLRPAQVVLRGRGRPAKKQR